ncbi:MAG: ABC transporter ATP-binding protein [Erysipelotrichia bacterium]|nr:ABC transporter ATP-binding protein [Erysipelotrichia bacterium]
MSEEITKKDKKDRVLSIRDLNISFETAAGTVNAIRGVRMDLFRGETIAIVGESGSGKSVTVKTIMGILAGNGKIESGEINYIYQNEKGETETVDMTKLSQKEIRYRFNGKHIAMVFQDPMTSLDPTMQIGKQIMEGMILHEKISKEEAKKRAIALLTEVGIENPEKRFKQYPHQLSGGMRQRVVIAIALACNPDILICDEPTTALDVTIQAKILELIKKIQTEKNIAVIYITHDLGVVAKVADYVDVMYAGRIIEKGSIDEIFYDPRHPYTWGLLASMPDTDTSAKRLFAIPGTPPNLLEKVTGDAFAPRNPFALKIDYESEPPMFNVGGQHRVASWLCDPRAPKVEMPDQLKERMAKMKEENAKYDNN